MFEKSFFHICADGADAKNFVVCEEDYKNAFNFVAICSEDAGISVVAFCIEDSHPHFLVYGTHENCLKFVYSYEASYKRYVTHSRGSIESIRLELIIYPVSEMSYLMKVGTYVVCQATKDGKRIMPYDYKWGTGALYFRSKEAIMPWRLDASGNLLDLKQIKDIPSYLIRKQFHTEKTIPKEWLICNGLIIPENYVDKEKFESIYKTHNCYRTFMASSRSIDTVIVEKTASIRGVFLEDMEVRKRAGELSMAMFGTKDIRILKADQRLSLALELRSSLNISKRQLATIVKLSLTEIEKYVR